MIKVVVRFPNPIDGRHEGTAIPIGGELFPARIYPIYHEPIDRGCGACGEPPGVYVLIIFVEIPVDEFDPLLITQSIETYIERRWGGFEFIRISEV